jgi:hypothetical protein
MSVTDSTERETPIIIVREDPGPYLGKLLASRRLTQRQLGPKTTDRIDQDGDHQAP